MADPAGGNQTRARVLLSLTAVSLVAALILISRASSLEGAEEWEETPEWLLAAEQGLLDEGQGVLQGETSSTKSAASRFGVDPSAPTDRASRARAAFERGLAAVTAERLEPFESDAAIAEYVASLDALHRLDALIDQRQQQPGQQAPMDAPGGGEPSITNNQTAGVDEGDIVKARGDHLVVLRRGRLFSVELGEDGALRAIARIDVPLEAGRGGWYDEMLVRGHRVIVIGYSYEERATELSFFDLDDDGHFTRVGTWFVSSGDYYSSRNYASRLVENTLVLYVPVRFAADPEAQDEARAAARLGLRRAGAETSTRLATATQIYRPVQRTIAPTLHAVVTCDVAPPEPICSTRGVLAPSSHVHYVTRDALYLWVAPRSGEATWLGPQPDTSVLYRIPFASDARPGAARVAGHPIDQFSFHEADDETLYVLVRDHRASHERWSRREPGDLALLRVGRHRLTTSVHRLSSWAFAPVPGRGDWSTRVHFVGDHLVYSIPDGRRASLAVVPFAGGGVPRVLELPHGVSRIEAMGSRAVAIGTDDDDGLRFSAVRLGSAPAVDAEHVEAGASESEYRSHGFFFRPGDGEEPGWLGLATAGDAASVLFLGAPGPDGSFARLGRLRSTGGRRVEDHCVASCVDWYGNSRPIFYRGRTFALLGYELIEGAVRDGALTEIGRTHLYADVPE